MKRKSKVELHDDPDTSAEGWGVNSDDYGYSKPDNQMRQVGFSNLFLGLSTGIFVVIVAGFPFLYHIYDSISSYMPDLETAATHTKPGLTIGFMVLVAIIAFAQDLEGIKGHAIPLLFLSIWAAIMVLNAADNYGQWIPSIYDLVQWVIFAMLYLVVGVLWSFAAWWLQVHKRGGLCAIGIKKGQKDKASRIVAQQEGRIVKWIMYWPFSIVLTAFRVFLKDAFIMLFDYMRVVYVYILEAVL